MSAPTAVISNLTGVAHAPQASPAKGPVVVRCGLVLQSYQEQAGVPKNDRCPYCFTGG